MRASVLPAAAVMASAPPPLNVATAASRYERRSFPLGINQSCADPLPVVTRALPSGKKSTPSTGWPVRTVNRRDLAEASQTMAAPSVDPAASSRPPGPPALFAERDALGD